MLQAPIRHSSATGSCLSTPLSDHLLKKWDIQGPRYTSYPSIDRMVEAVRADDFEQLLRRRSELMAGRRRELSLYVHIPFCHSLCFYCACNKIVTRKHSLVEKYLTSLRKESERVAQVLRPQASDAVAQLHFGGGTPTFLSDLEIGELMGHLRATFPFARDIECSIEIDPRTVDPARLERLRELGVNRLSFGIQDFDEQVQLAINRVQPVDKVQPLVDAARQLGFTSTNFDLIYGLPYQSSASLAQTLRTVVGMRPGRIALYGYAHLPDRFKPQRRLSAMPLPSARERSTLLNLAIHTLEDAGYVHIGMDHFALPSDSLAHAKRNGRLYRNFQGYSTDADCDLLGLGVSAISKVGRGYFQNSKVLADYQDQLDRGQLPIERGLILDADDLLRRTLVMAIMCQGTVDFSAVGAAHLVNIREYFAEEWAALEALAADGLIELDEHSLHVTPQGWTLVRVIARVFDRYARDSQRRAQFSKVI
jgi:oxygen-independent coproporphyrinogen III oxidase